MASDKAMLHYSCSVTRRRLKETLYQSQVCVARCMLNSMQPDALQRALICGIWVLERKAFLLFTPLPFPVSLGQDLSPKIIVPIKYLLIEQSSHLLMSLFINKFMLHKLRHGLLQTVYFSWRRLSTQQNSAGSSTLKQGNVVLTLFLNLLWGEIHCLRDCEILWIASDLFFR